MKKLMILMLVLGMASLANAALTGIELSVNGVTDGPGNVTEIEIPICTEVKIGIVGPDEYFYLGYIIIDLPGYVVGSGGAGGEWGDDIGPHLPMCNGWYYEKSGYPEILAGAGDTASAIRYEEDDWGFGYEIQAADSQSLENVGGEEFNFIYHCCGPESEWVTITLWDDAEGYEAEDVQDTILIHQYIIPEPMTIALLGLGGLFLRHRKK